MKHLFFDFLYSLALKIVLYAFLILILLCIYYFFGKEYLENNFDEYTINLVLTLAALALCLIIIVDISFFIENSISGMLKIRKERSSRFNIIKNVSQRELLCRNCHKYFMRVYIPDNLNKAQRGMVYCLDCAKKLGIEGIFVDEKEYLKFHIQMANDQRSELLEIKDELDQREHQYERYNITYLGSFRRERQVLLERINNIEDKISRLKRFLSGGSG